MSSRLCLIFILALTSVRAEEKPEPAAAFEKIVQDLASDDAAVRDKAAQALRELPAGAYPLAQAELKKTNLSPAVRTQLEDALPALHLRQRQLFLIEQRQKELEWNHKTMRDAYLAVGHRDAKWNDKAVRALESVAIYYSTPFKDRNHGRVNAIIKLCDECFALGCEDPYLLYTKGRMTEVNDNTSPEAPKLYLKALEKMKEYKYPPIRHLLVWLRLCSCYASEKDPIPDANKAKMKECMERGCELLAEAVKDKDIPLERISDVVSEALTYYSLMGMSSFEGYDELVEKIPEKGQAHPVFLMWKARIANSEGWKARGGGFADTVTPEGWKIFHEGLATARAALEKSYALNPQFAPVTELMLTVLQGQGAAREEFELWYERARDNDADSFAVCEGKMYYLLPRWHGTREELLKFGHELFKEGNWGANLPVILIHSHNWLADGDLDYYKSPGVWDDIKLVMDEYMKRHPRSNADRSNYARYACVCGQWLEADKIFKQLGDNLEKNVFKSPAELRQYREEIAKAIAGKQQ